MAELACERDAHERRERTDFVANTRRYVRINYDTLRKPVNYQANRS